MSEFTGVFSLVAEDQDERSAETLAIRWIRLLCEALDVLHSNGLIHGDISPRNMIVSGTSLVLTDYDFISRTGETAARSILDRRSVRGFLGHFLSNTITEWPSFRFQETNHVNRLFC